MNFLPTTPSRTTMRDSFFKKISNTYHATMMDLDHAPAEIQSPIAFPNVTDTEITGILDDDHFRSITGSLRSENGTSYTWSVKAFKRWKKDFKRLFRQYYGQELSELITDPNQRERLYKSILGMQGFDVFRNGHTEGILHIEETVLSTCKAVAMLIAPENMAQ